MTQILGVAEAALYVSDINRAKKFYQTVLDLPVTAEFGDSCFLQTGPNSAIILFQLDSLKSRRSMIPIHGAEGQGHVALAVPAEQLQAWRQRLLDYGVEIEHEQDWSQGTHSIYFRDPDQNSLELIESSHYNKVWQMLKKNATEDADFA